MEPFKSYFPLLAAAIAYLIGSISFAVVVSRLMGLHDPRTYGSKNPGATNVLRSGSKATAVLTLLLDGAKGNPAQKVLAHQHREHHDRRHEDGHARRDLRPRHAVDVAL